MKKPAKRKATARTAHRAKPDLVTIRVNPDHLSEDELDYLYYLKHKNDPTYAFDELLTKLGYEMVPTGQKKR